MANSSLPPVAAQGACKAAQSVERPQSVKYTEETLPTRLCEAVEYFNPYIVKVFLVSEGVYSHKGCERLVKGEKMVSSIVPKSFV